MSDKLVKEIPVDVVLRMRGEDRMNQTEWEVGAASARDSIIALLIGMQNNLADWGSERCKAYDEVLSMIFNTYGDLFKPFKH